MEKMIVTLFDYYPKLGKNSQELYRKGFTMFIEAMSSSPAMLKKCLSHIGEYSLSFLSIFHKFNSTKHEN